MKKFIVFFILILAGSHIATAQELDRLMEEVAKNEKAQRQVVDKAMLGASVAQAQAQDSTGELKSKMPSFMQKIDSIQVVTLKKNAPDTRNMVLDNLNSFKDDDVYSTLVRVKDGEDNVRIIAKRDGETVSDVYILVMDEEDIVLVKMSGRLEQSDLEDIVKEQAKNKK
jgi:predicted CopG family antitoxin